MNAEEKFKSLLKDLFQFDASDLDFGIYRIINYKRNQIENFINNTLSSKINKAFEKFIEQIKKDIDNQINELHIKIIEDLDNNAFNSDGSLKQEFTKSNLGKKYLNALKQKNELLEIEDIKSHVYNDLYNFFSRFYEDGDFIPKYRYSIKNYKYAIPYNGEEVKLYWVNADQYYIKTGYLFRDYTFKANGFLSILRTIEAKEELGSNKATKERFFVLDDDNPIETSKNNLIVRFQYRELTEKEIKHYEVSGGSNFSKQEKINEKSFEKIKDYFLEKKEYVLIRNLINNIKNDKPLLLYHLNRFTAKNTKDYFIHKNLKKFLSSQLDYFIKAEVLNIDSIYNENYFEKHLTRAKIVKEIGDEIIEFLSELEDFQKKLWEKKKFILKTDYVITLDKIKEYAGSKFLESILPEILENKNQLKEWKELGLLNDKIRIAVNENLFGQEYNKLPIDTRFFSNEFKEKLLEAVSNKFDLDDILDGLLIKSENWQALNLLLNKYKDTVQTIYIDPPFNKEQDADYLYNVKYKDSTWACMLENRLKLAKDLLNDKGSIFVRCDYNGNWIVRPVMNEIFGEGNFRNEIIINRTRAKQIVEKQFVQQTESLFFYSKSEELLIKEVERTRNPEWHSLLHFPRPDDKPRIILGKEFYPPKGRRWALSQERITKFETEGKIRINKDLIYIDCRGKLIKGIPELLYDTEIIGNEWIDIPGYGQTQHFSTENSEILLKRVIQSTTNENDLVIDFFLGSGTTTAVAHKLGRKWIGVEMGEHFWTVILPRMKKVLAYDKSGISKEKDVKEKYNEDKAGGFFKYYELEQFPDILDKAKYLTEKESPKLFKEDFNYIFMADPKMLEALEIDYENNKIKIDFSKIYPNVDIAETLSCLKGKWIKKISENEIEFEDGEKVSLNQLEKHLPEIKKLIWW